MIPAANAAVVTWRRGILLVGGIAIGLMSSWLAWQGPAYSFGGSSPVLTAVELAAGWTLLVVGLAADVRRPWSRFGRLLALAGIAWFLVEWPNPAAAGSLVFSVGLVLRVAYPALIGHAALAFPGGRLVSPVERTTTVVAYVTNLVVLGLLPALFFQPAAARCAACPENLVAIGSSPDLVASSMALGLRLEVAWAAIAVVLMIDRLARSSGPARRLLAPVVLPAMAFLVLVGVAAVTALPRGSLSNDPLDLGLWLGQAVALTALAIGVELEPARARRARRRIASVAVDLAGSAPTGSVRGSLASTLGDPSLQLVYAVGDGRLADSDGQEAEVLPEPGRTATRVERDGALVAVLSHRSDLLDDPERLRESIAAARIAIENEQLQAEIRARQIDLRVSRQRIVEASDRERRHLERDLHDGAQQRLVALSMALGVERLRRGPDPGLVDSPGLAEADEEVREALSDLRVLAHGIYPIELADGLAAGVAALAEGAPIPIRVIAVPDRRLDPAVESAAYFAIAEATLRSGAVGASVDARVVDDRLLIGVAALGSQQADVMNIEDRVGALDGLVATSSLGGAGVRIDVEIPCAS